MPTNFGGTTRKRKLPVSLPPYRLRVWSRNSGTVITNRAGTVNTKKWEGSQHTESLDHSNRWKAARKSRNAFKGDIGGPFFTEKKYCLVNDNAYSLDGRPVGTETQVGIYSGPLTAIDPNGVYGGFPTSIASPDVTLEALGAKAISNTKPTNPVADMTTFLGETIKDGIPKLLGASNGYWKGNTERALKAGADDYLSLEFAWKPMIRDIRSIANAIHHADAVIRQYERDAGKLVRRRFAFPTESGTEITQVASGIAPFMEGGVSGPFVDSTAPALGSVVRTRDWRRKRWFSGAFTYYLPSGYSQNDGVRELAHQAKITLGLELTPEVVWNLTPWSWAVDWFTNAGDVISNVSDILIDGLVVRYGYIMEHTVVHDRYTYVGSTRLKSRNTRPEDVTFVTETKKRLKATPYGFGLTWSSFTDRQLAILAALGISKSR